MSLSQSPQGENTKRLIMCERDVGLFSLIQQVVGCIPWSIQERSVPVVYFENKTCYWKPDGYRGAKSTWEYYFEPLDPIHPASTIPHRIQQIIRDWPPNYSRVGYSADKYNYITNHFGDHPELIGKTDPIPYLWQDPDMALRQRAGKIMRRYIRPRSYLKTKASKFYTKHFSDQYVIGVHMRGTDAISTQEKREHRQNSLKLEKYSHQIRSLMRKNPQALIFVATDDESSLRYLQDRFAERVVACDSIRHKTGAFAGAGPTGWIMPAYIAGDCDVAVKNGEEALIEFLILCQCDYLIHNASSLARTVLLAIPELPHTNTHHKPKQPGC